jgi:uncharacterized protein YmfQ (DUF2313 family)
VDLIKLNVWRNALVAEWERLSALPNAGADEQLQRRLRRIEAEVELIEERINETVGAAD